MRTTRHLLRSLTILPLLSMLMLTACGQAGKSSATNPDAFEQAITAKAQLIDVRTAGEYANGHLKGARNLDWTNGELKSAMVELDKSAPVLVYCASGRRSAAAREALVKAGFKDVTDLAGGIQAWTANGKPVVR
ncbi:MAG TPA: rhodanese-like domain-containing protein [Flavobacteriales bacterium]|nr:rhodanese-like domain-containing protein [Flavobacteriales bacterium]